MRARPSVRAHDPRWADPAGAVASRRLADGTLVQTEKIIFCRVVRHGPEIFYTMEDVRSDRHIVSADLYVETVIAAVDHVGNLFSRVVPISALRIETAHMSDVLARAVRVRLSDTSDLICHDVAP